MEGNNPIKFELKKDPIFREKLEPQIEARELFFSQEIDNLNNNDGEKGEKTFSLFNKQNEDKIGSIYYDYPKEKPITNTLKVRSVGLEEKYRGQNLGIKLYEHLMDLSKEKGLEGVCSDSTVQGGGLVVWKKLADKGYNLEVNPLVEEVWKEFVDTYDDNRMFKKMLTVPKEESVFTMKF